MTNQSNAKPARSKPKKNGWESPYPDFPLSYHPPSGRLDKKIKGHRYYFGKATDWQASLDYNFKRKSSRSVRIRKHYEKQRVDLIVRQLPK